MKIAVVYNEPAPDRTDSADVLEEVGLVRGALDALGHSHSEFSIDEDGLDALRPRLEGFAPDLAFNLVEELNGRSNYLPVAAYYFEALGIAYTGSRYDCLVSTNDKALSKAVLSANGVPTPAWRIFRGADHPTPLAPPLIVKPAWEHASVGIDDRSVYLRWEDLRNALAQIYETNDRQPILVEEYIEGREFNVSLIERGQGRAEALPVAEMAFEDWPEGKPRIVNYSAKWDRGAFEYSHTRRRFDPTDAPLEDIRREALRCWRAFGIKGYARVDMRVDRSGGVWVIEVNTNPCISPDAGFMAAAARAGLSEADVVKEIIEAALR